MLCSTKAFPPTHISASIIWGKGLCRTRALRCPLVKMHGNITVHVVNVNPQAWIKCLKDLIQGCKSLVWLIIQDICFNKWCFRPVTTNAPLVFSRLVWPSIKTAEKGHRTRMFTCRHGSKMPCIHATRVAFQRDLHHIKQHIDYLKSFLMYGSSYLYLKKKHFMNLFHLVSSIKVFIVILLNSWPVLISPALYQTNRRTRDRDKLCALCKLC